MEITFIPAEWPNLQMNLNELDWRHDLILLCQIKSKNYYL